jgi:hypothetical protein
MQNSLGNYNKILNNFENEYNNKYNELNKDKDKNDEHNKKINDKFDYLNNIIFNNSTFFNNSICKARNVEGKFINYSLSQIRDSIQALTILKF